MPVFSTKLILSSKTIICSQLLIAVCSWEVSWEKAKSKDKPHVYLYQLISHKNVCTLKLCQLFVCQFVSLPELWKLVQSKHSMWQKMN